MSEYDQDGRLLRIETTLGANKVLLIDLEGTEAISRPFLFRITMETQEPEAKVREMLGEAVTLWIGASDDSDARPIHGHFRRISRQHTKTNDNHVWQAEVVPALWFLSRKADCRIFQNMTAVQVLEKMFKAHGVQFTDKRTNATYPTMKYCVQYRETAFDFVSRLMEEFGIFYWHEFEAKKHTLVFSDVNIKAKMMKPDTVTYGGVASGEKLDWLTRDIDFRSGAFAMRDFNFKTPGTMMAAREPTSLAVPRMSDHEVFDYPGRYQTPSRGSAVARLRIEAEEAHFSTLSGGGDTKSFAAGCRVNIDDSVVNENKLHLITEVRHSARDTSFWVKSGGHDSHYKNEFAAIEATVPYRPLRLTPRPMVMGPQTATVTGPPGSEIHTDEFGRVKVRFHWDRNPDGHSDTNPSCWVRVSQGWAGKNWGMMHIPRVGHEVVVDFLEGDPDRPLVVGRVYNNENMPPWTLPANKTQSGIMSRSTLGGGAANANIFRFEDKKGSEQILLHAEKNLDTEVENDETHWVGHDRTTTIDHDDKLLVKNNLTTEVNANKKTTVGGNFEETITGNEKRTVSGKVDETVTGNYTMTVNGRLNMLVAQGVGITTPLDVTVTSSTGVTVIAPTKTTVAPSWFKSGAASGDAYGFKMGIAGMKMDIVGFALGMIVLKMDFAGIKFDTFGIAIKTGGLELKNATLKAKTYAFTMAAGFHIKT
ncbi:type VI secretion system Vgr family protein [Plastoroseomonas arctica]|uniref:Type VI secretion system tip protein VgrG n=1 Tax=Plastoroseomonas arctica TaxID=1509237 RepID=A0AAF1KIP3_9PROT|nr:type VI secretion system tip protein TssI/VgrG [Plastoroseomonas arctica]MBR0654360.1 type VI secretion system tip protein VgrG [Plastoroseomonas arctica]